MITITGQQDILYVGVGTRIHLLQIRPTRYVYDQNTYLIPTQGLLAILPDVNNIPRCGQHPRKASFNPRTALYVKEKWDTVVRDRPCHQGYRPSSSFIVCLVSL